MTQSSQFIILAVTKIGEKSLVLHTLSADWGRRSFIVSVSKSSGMALFLPLNILDAEVTENSKSDLWRMKSICTAHPLNGIRGSMGKNAITMFMSEVLYRTVRDGVCEDGLFDWCCRSILTLDALESDFSNYHLRFLLELCGALGFNPGVDDIMPFAGPYLKVIEEFMQLDFSSSMLYPLTGEVRNELASIFLKYLSWHTESSINVKSLAVLREVLRG